MTDNELLNQIKQSANQLEVPFSITPEQISSKLQNTSSPSPHFVFPSIRTISAAAVFLFMGILSVITWNTVYHPAETVQNESVSLSDASGNVNPDSMSSKDTPADEPKKNAGSFYTIAKSYDQIYDVLSASDSYYEYGVNYDLGDIATADGEAGVEMNIKESAADIAGSAAATSGTGSDMASKNEFRGEESQKSAEDESYSTTNLQTEGVDESDLIKTDGSYIYTVKDQYVFITDTTNGILKQTASLHPDLNAADSILEIYVDNDTLILLVQHYDTSLEESSDVDSDDSDTTYSKKSAFLPLEDVADTNFLQTSCSTVLYVYDIKDPSSPVLQGTTTQDGFYHTSRKIGDIIYLFTQEGLSPYAAYPENAKTEGAVIPCVNDQKIPYDHVYLPKEGSNGLICSSVNITNPQEVIDNIMIVYDYAEIYVGNDSIYLYQHKYQSNETLTEIAKFHIEEGSINAVNASSVKGIVNDTFAIQEYQNNLRILTTSYDNNGVSSNQLYLLDENLKLVGSLEDIARGEEIYAARYFKNTAYFITYRNTDPLFAVDLSDPSNPTLLGELKISGFSEYLHFWGEDTLLGIGHETNPDTGEFLGLKLVMFDISNPADLKAIDSLVLKQYYYSPALYNYKCVLADFSQNLIGFAAESDSDADYNIYAWENDHFVQKLTNRLPDQFDSNSIRGIYIGDKFYIAAPSDIISYDMSNNFQEISRITLQK